MPIVPSNPIVIPSVTYDQLWLADLRIGSIDPSKKVNAFWTLRPYSVTNGVIASSPKTISGTIQDLLTVAASRAAGSPAVAAVEGVAPVAATANTPAIPGRPAIAAVAAVAPKPKLALAIQAVLDALQEIAQEEGKI